MTPHASHFSQKTPLASSLIIYTPDSSHMSVGHIGTVSSPNLTIPDIYLVPKLFLNLLFVGQLCELGLDLHFSNRGVDVQDPLTSKLLGTGRKIGRLFELCNLQIPSHMVSSSIAATTTLSPDLWHSHLGHASLSRLQLLASQGHLESLCLLCLSSFPMNETNLNLGLDCVVFSAMEHQTFSSCQHFPFIFSSMTPIFTDPSIDLYPDLVRDSAPPLSSSDVLSLALSPAAGSPASDLAPSAPSESPTDLRLSTRMDMKNAFINGDLLEEVYMQPPPGYPNSQNQGFTPSPYDSALFIRHTSTGITLILLYVDDMIITGDDTAGICDLQKFLSQHFEMKDLGTLNYFLGLKVTSSSDGYYLS
uniref:Uncharacterized protein n=1 Tax=Fagus sylvatica TaxID=28930 RepID=A0A2N9GEW1_FAGSY